MGIKITLSLYMAYPSNPLKMLLLKWLLLVVVRFVAREVVSDMGPPTSMGDSHFGGERGGLLEECCDILQIKYFEIINHSMKASVQIGLPQSWRR